METLTILPPILVAKVEVDPPSCLFKVTVSGNPTPDSNFETPENAVESPYSIMYP